MDEKHILISLGDDKIKQIAEVIGNKTCNKILDLLSAGDLTVTDISHKLKIPINTADYNIKKLIKSGLIEKANHFWSVKGKKMPTYKVSNRKIIISPKKSITKVFAWIVGLTVLSALTIRELTKPVVGVFDDVAVNSFMAAKDSVIEEASFRSAPEIQSLVTNTAVSQTLMDTTINNGFWQSLSPWMWFLLGAWFTIVLFFVFNILNERRKNK